jgi:hypothetical protein
MAGTAAVPQLFQEESLAGPMLFLPWKTDEIADRCAQGPPTAAFAGRKPRVGRQRGRPEQNEKGEFTVTRKWTITVALFAALAFLALPCASAQAGVFVSVGIPGPWFGPYHHHYPYYYGPRVVVAAPPVVYAPAYAYPQPNVIYVQPAPQVVQPPAPAPLPPPLPVTPGQ